MRLVYIVLGTILIIIMANVLQQYDLKQKQLGHNHMQVMASGNDYKVQAEFAFSTDRLQAGQDAQLSIKLADANGQPIKRFSIYHEKKLHLIIVNRELTYFDHIHPEFAGDGLFTIATRFPAGGEYKLIADFVPKGQGVVTESHWVTVAGDVEQAEPVPLVPDAELLQVIGEKEVRLTFDHLMAGMELDALFSFKDRNTNKAITNLQTYLGAIGHVVIMSEDAEQYIHAHPADQKTRGPIAKFKVTFPKPGVYKIWGQFQHEDSLFIAPFVIEVPY
jgi:hypothetical protein